MLKIKYDSSEIEGEINFIFDNYLKLNKNEEYSKDNSFLEWFKGFISLRTKKNCIYEICSVT